MFRERTIVPDPQHTKNNDLITGVIMPSLSLQSTLSETSATTAHIEPVPRPVGTGAARGGNARSHKPSVVPGLMLACSVGAVAWGLGNIWPIIGGPVFGIVLGLLIRNLLGVGVVFRQGLAFCARQVLQLSIIALGFGLSIQQVARTGLESIWVTLISVSAAFLTAWLLGRMLGISGKLKMLIGVGTAICGGSAIAAVTPVIRPEEHETAYAISTIFLFNIVAVLVFPLLGHWLNLSDTGFGLWAGTAINDTSSVVAAAYSYSQAAGDYATVVKLTRATLIIPICLVLAVLVAWKEKQQGSTGLNLVRIFPWFILWFLVASLVRSAGLIPETMLPWLQTAAHALIIVSLTAIGLSSDMRRMAVAGIRPVLLGLGVWVAVAGSSLAVQALTGGW